jgi:zinc protease
MEGRAAALAGAEALQGIEVLDREYEALSSLDVAAVRDAAAQYLTPDGVAALAYLPPGAAGDLTAAAVVNAFSASPSKRVVVAPVAAPLRPGRPVGGVADAGVWHFQLPGADLLIRPKPGVPIVTLGIYALRQSLDPPARAGLGALLVRSAIRGAGGLDGGALAAAFERLGGSVGTSIAQDWLGFRTTVQAERLAEAAALLDLVFRSPALEASEVGAELRLMIDEARQAEDDMFRFPFQLAFRAAFGDSGYGLPTGGLPETLRGITTEDVRRWHQTVVVPQRVTIVAVGEIDPQQAAEALAGSLADRPTAAAAGPLPSADWGAAGSSRVRVETRNKAQSAVAMVFPGPSRSQTERFAGDVWAAVASGLGGRLFEALRDRRSLAYTVMGSTWQKGRGGALVTYIATSPEREAEAREAMLDELERFAVEGITPDELARAVNYLAGQVEVNRQSGIQLLSDIAEAWLIGEGLRDLRDPGGQYRAVAAESVRALAVAHLRPELRAEGIVRGKSRD